MNRREFLVSSSAGLAGASLVGCLPGRSNPPRRRRRHSTISVAALVTSRARAARSATSSTATARSRWTASFPRPRALRRGIEAEVAEGDRSADQHSPSRRSHGGNSVFKPVVKHIVCQEKCLEWHKKTAAAAANPAPQAYADLTFGESWSSTLGDEKVWAFYNGAGHTSGDAVIVFEKANVVHMGDLMFNRLHPRLDFAAGGSARNWIKVLNKVAKGHRDATFIFGHAKAGDAGHRVGERARVLPRLSVASRRHGAEGGQGKAVEGRAREGERSSRAFPITSAAARC